MSERPNIVFVMTDDHAAHALSAYDSRLTTTPQLDRIANEGARLDNTFCTNALCAPSRASILTGTYSHVNGVRTLATYFDNRQTTFAHLLRDAGYATGLFGKWHLGHGPDHDPRGFDEWQVLYDQGPYWNPTFASPEGDQTYDGYTTDVITDLALDWLTRRDPDQPFCLLVHHKAPHRPWEPTPEHAKLFAEVELPLPETWDDDYSHRSEAARTAQMRVREHLTDGDLKEPVPEGLSGEAAAYWIYQRYLRDYLACVASVDDNVGRLLDYLDANELTENTVVVYTSDQGFFLGDHGWYDKRFMYEESLRMPFLVRYPREIPAGSVRDEITLNVDFAQTFLDYAGVPGLDSMQGRSMRSLLAGTTQPDWRDSMYYRYWHHDDPSHHVRAHFGVRTKRHKLVYYNGEGFGFAGTSDRRFDGEWELFDLERDPRELRSVHDEPEYAAVRAELTAELGRLQDELGDDLGKRSW